MVVVEAEVGAALPQLEAEDSEKRRRTANLVRRAMERRLGKSQGLQERGGQYTFSHDSTNLRINV